MRPSLVACLLTILGGVSLSRGDEPRDIITQRELFVDDYLVDKLTGDAKLQLQRPEPREVVFVTGEPWEGNTSAYYTIFQDGEMYRMYYRGSHFLEDTKQSAHREVTCYAESKDGVHWTKPDLGLFEFNGSKHNNIVWDGLGTHCFAAFKDENPACPAESRYKAISRGEKPAQPGLYVFQSPDGIHWSLISDKPVITKGAFDSQNLAFWDPQIQQYREYHRIFVDGVRAIMTGTSKDFVTWSEPVLLDFGDAPKEHLYTNAVRPYARAPQILLGFPTRFLPNENSRVEPTFMAGRDGRAFKRWPEAVIPEDAPEDRDGNRSNYMTWGLLQLPGEEKELSVYATEAYYTGPSSRVRRFTYRVDGFVALSGGADGGSLTTKPLRFAGDKLTVNFVTRNGGAARVELQDANGQPIDGFALADCRPLQGDEIEHVVQWRDSDVSSLAGQVIRLRIEVRNADVYAFQFTK